MSHPAPEMLKELGFKEGVVTTGSSFDHTEMDDKMMDENGKYPFSSSRATC